MSTPLHAVFNVVSGNVYFVIVTFNICDRKRRSSESTQNSISQNRFLVTLRSFFSTYKFFLGRGWFFPVSTFKEEYFNEKMSSLAGLKKVIQFYAKVPILAIFDYLGPPSKSIFSTYRQNFEKSSVCFLGGIVRNIVLNFQLSIFKKVRGGSRFASRHFPKSVILASRNIVGRPFVACYACSIGILHSSQ